MSVDKILYLFAADITDARTPEGVVTVKIPYNKGWGGKLPEQLIQLLGVERLPPGQIE